jgi:hypothetical protein
MTDYNYNESADDADEYPQHRRLVLISVNACDFCDSVETPGPYMYYISIETKNGWVTCSNEMCKSKGEAALDHYMRTKAYGRANVFRGKMVKVKRTSGHIEDNWKLSKHFVEPVLDASGNERVCVVNETEEIEKWVSVDHVLQWNSVV